MTVHTDSLLDDPPEIDSRRVPGRSASLPLEPVSEQYIPRSRLIDPGGIHEQWKRQVVDIYQARSSGNSSRLAGLIKKAGRTYSQLTDHQVGGLEEIEEKLREQEIRKRRELKRVAKQEELERKLAEKRHSGRVDDERKVKKYTR